MNEPDLSALTHLACIASAAAAVVVRLDIVFNHRVDDTAARLHAAHEEGFAAGLLEPWETDGKTVWHAQHDMARAVADLRELLLRARLITPR